MVHRASPGIIRFRRRNSATPLSNITVPSEAGSGTGANEMKPTLSNPVMYGVEDEKLLESCRISPWWLDKLAVSSPET
jgi:hypothetical protein